MATMKGYRLAAGWSQLETDFRGGFQDAYVGKLERPDRRWGKRAIAPLFWQLLRDLGLVLILVPAGAKVGNCPCCGRGATTSD